MYGAEESQKDIYNNNKYIKNQKRYVFYAKAKRKVTKIKNFVKRMRVFLKLILLVLLLYALSCIWKLPQWYISDDIFDSYPNNSLNIQDNQIISTDKIITQLQQIVLKEEPIYCLDTEPIEKVLMELTPIKKVFVRRFWLPARLKIVVTEKTPVLSVAPNFKIEPTGIFTEDGTIIEKDFFPLNYDGKIYRFITFDDYKKWSSKHVHFLNSLANLSEKVAKENIEYIDIRNPDDVYVQLKTIRLRIGELNKTVFKRIKLTASVLPKIVDYKNKLEYIDLRWEHAPAIKLKNNKKQKKINKFKFDD